MAYTGTYRAYAKAFDGTLTEWTGLRQAQALWRYNWIARQARRGLLAWPKEYGWEREWKA